MDADRTIREPEHVAFVRAVATQGFRLTYEGLSRVYRLCNGEKPEAASNGTHGVWVAQSALPGFLQPFICRTQGDYEPATISHWAEHGIDAPDDLLNRKVIPAKNAVAAFEAWHRRQGAG